MSANSRNSDLSIAVRHWRRDESGTSSSSLTPPASCSKTIELSIEYGGTVSGIMHRKTTITVTMQPCMTMRQKYRIISIAYSTCLPVPSDVLTLPSDPSLDSLCRADKDKDGHDQLDEHSPRCMYIPSCTQVRGPVL